jgi:hypothetical protein
MGPPAPEAQRLLHEIRRQLRVIPAPGLAPDPTKRSKRRQATSVAVTLNG